jgi:hypothetical protein
MRIILKEGCGLQRDEASTLTCLDGPMRSGDEERDRQEIRRSGGQEELFGGKGAHLGPV